MGYYPIFITFSKQANQINTDITPFRERYMSRDKKHKKRFKTGRNRPFSKGYAPHLKHYINLRELPKPPEQISYIEKSKSTLKNIYLNDQFGCCVISGICHLAGLFSANADRGPIEFTSREILDLYSKIGGFDPRKPTKTDNGCDENSALNYWREQGLPHDGQTHKILGWLRIDATNISEVKMALWLFENLLFGVVMPDEWTANEDSIQDGTQWNFAGAPNPENGHCFIGVGYDQSGVIVDSWGFFIHLSNDAITKYAAMGALEIYVALSEETVNQISQKAPNGFDLSTLKQDFVKLSGSL